MECRQIQMRPSICLPITSTVCRLQHRACFDLPSALDLVRNEKSMFTQWALQIKLQYVSSQPFPMALRPTLRSMGVGCLSMEAKLSSQPNCRLHPIRLSEEFLKKVKKVLSKLEEKGRRNIATKEMKRKLVNSAPCQAGAVVLERHRMVNQQHQRTFYDREALHCQYIAN